MLSVFESNVANGFGSMKIYNLKVKCTISCNVFSKNYTFSSMLLYINLGSHYSCHNPSFGFTTKTRAYKGAGQEGSLEVTFHVRGSVGECEGMNPKNPK
jgi:hypothetical protein